MGKAYSILNSTYFYVECSNVLIALTMGSQNNPPACAVPMSLQVRYSTFPPSLLQGGFALTSFLKGDGIFQGFILISKLFTRIRFAQGCTHHNL